MVQANINIGTAPNDSTGDPLRTAFTKINANFTDLYGNLNTGVVQLVGNSVITVSTNTNLNLIPNGTGDVVVGANNQLFVINPQTTSSPTTGALVVTGGAGFGSNVNVASYVNSQGASLGFLENTVIGGNTAAAGSFTQLNTSNFTSTNYTNTNILTSTYASIGILISNNATLNNPTLTNAAISLSSLAVPSINSTPIGNSSPASGAFSTLLVGTAANLLAGTPLSGNVIYVVGNANSYSQISIQNLSSSSYASGDFIVTADNGTDSTNYLDLGLNNSGYNNPAYNISYAGDGYLYTSNGNIAIGTAFSTANVVFHAGGTTQANKMFAVNANGSVISYAPFYAATHAGNVTFTGNIIASNYTITGNISGSAASATTATVATTASTASLATNAGNVVYASQANITSVGVLNGLTINGNLTVLGGGNVFTLYGYAALGGNTQVSGGLQYTNYVVNLSVSTTPTLVANVPVWLIDSTAGATISAATVTFPANASVLDGTQVKLVSNITVTTLTCTAGSGTTINGAPTTINSSTPYTFYLWKSAPGGARWLRA
jgi:hypothetical protein